MKNLKGGFTCCKIKKICKLWKVFRKVCSAADFLLKIPKIWQKIREFGKAPPVPVSAFCNLSHSMNVAESFILQRKRGICPRFFFLFSCFSFVFADLHTTEDGIICESFVESGRVYRCVKRGRLHTTADFSYRQTPISATFYHRRNANPFAR